MARNTYFKVVWTIKSYKDSNGIIQPERYYSSYVGNIDSFRFEVSSDKRQLWRSLAVEYYMGAWVAKRQGDIGLVCFSTFKDAQIFKNKIGHLRTIENILSLPDTSGEAEVFTCYGKGHLTRKYIPADNPYGIASYYSPKNGFYPSGGGTALPNSRFFKELMLLEKVRA